VVKVHSVESESLMVGLVRGEPRTKCCLSRITRRISNLEVHFGKNLPRFQLLFAVIWRTRKSTFVGMQVVDGAEVPSSLPNR
jgi:hypothetical protein